MLSRAGCGVLLFGLASAGCSNQAGTVPTPELTKITLGVPESNAQGEDTGAEEFVRMLTQEGLVRVGNDGHAVPWLASGWTWEENSTRLRIHLRPKVLLHDGTPLEAELAAKLLKEGLENRRATALYPALGDIESITTQGSLDVILNLSRTSPLLPADLGMPLRSEKAGTGPYRVESESPDGVVLKRFDEYHQGRPTIGEVVVKPFDTLRNAWTSLLRGEVDVVSDVPADAVEFVRNEDVQVVPYARRYQFLIAFNSRRGALRSPAVRRALNLAVDRQALIARVLQDAGTPSTGPLWPRYWAYDSSVQPYPFSPQQAAALLDDAGYRIAAGPATAGPPARFRFTCLIPEGYAVLERIALEVQKNLLNVGVDMRIESVPPKEFGPRIESGNFDAVLNDMSSGPTPARAYVFWRSRRAYEGPVNVFGYENAEAEKLFTTLNTSTNDAAVRSATTRLQHVLLNDPPALFLVWNARARAIRRAILVPEREGDPLASLWQWTAAPVTSTR